VNGILHVRDTLRIREFVLEELMTPAEISIPSNAVLPMPHRESRELISEPATVCNILRMHVE